MSIGKQLLDNIRFVASQTVLLSQIKFDSNNPNTLTQDKQQALEKTVDKWGFAVDPWLNDQGDGTYLVIDGEHRIRLLQKKGVTKVEAKIFKVPYVEVQMLRQIANKLRGEHDRKKDAFEFKAIFEEDNLDMFSEFSAIPMEELHLELEKEFDMTFEKQEEEIPEPPVEPKSKLGEVYQLGNHRVMCGDSTKDLDKLINGIDIDLLLTDPPYGIDVVNVKGQVGLSGVPSFGKVGKPGIVKARIYKKFQGDAEPFNPVFLLKYGKKQIIFGANYFANLLPSQPHWLVWDKKAEIGYDHNNFSDVELMWTNIPQKNCEIYRFLWSGLLRAGDRKTELKERVHPTQKPVGLLSDIIKDYSDENQTVLEPYLGSGSTLIACEQTNRICFGMEIDPGYVDVIITRWENFTGKKAVLL